MLGTIPLTKRVARVGNALTMGVGMAILAKSRPYEGPVYSIPIAIALITWMLGRNAPSVKILFPRIIAPLAVVLLITGLFITYYDWRVTGSPFVMPHQIGEKAYIIVLKFLWQHARPEPDYHHQVFRDYNRIVEVPFSFRPAHDVNIQDDRVLAFLPGTSIYVAHPHGNSKPAAGFLLESDKHGDAILIYCLCCLNRWFCSGHDIQCSLCRSCDRSRRPSGVDCDASVT